MASKSRIEHNGLYEYGGSPIIAVMHTTILIEYVWELGCPDTIELLEFMDPDS